MGIFTLKPDTPQELLSKAKRQLDATNKVVGKISDDLDPEVFNSFQGLTATTSLLIQIVEHLLKGKK